YAWSSAWTSDLRESGETGRRAGLRIRWARALGGSTPPSRTTPGRSSRAGKRSRMKVAVEEIEGCKRRLAVEAPVDVVQKERERAYGRGQKRAALPGFRKGHVPRSLVKLHLADDVRREVAEHLIPDVYRQALTEARIDPVNEPDLQELTLEENAPLSFKAVVEVKPVIALGDYRGVEVEHTTPSVTDADVAHPPDRLPHQHP